MKSSALAQRIGAVCEGGDVDVSQVSSFAAATPQSLVFVEHARFLQAALDSLAAAIIVPAEAAPAGECATAAANNTAPANGKVLLRARNPRLAFALAAEELRRAAPDQLPPAADPGAPTLRRVTPRPSSIPPPGCTRRHGSRNSQ